jgi:hypothetical protein
MGLNETQRESFAAAARRFPDLELPIRRLFDTSENFRDICAELAEAEIALSTAEHSATASKEDRAAEWRELVDRLVGEVELAIRADVSARTARLR